MAKAPSGSCSGPGRAVCGRLRPLGPSGDDCRDVLVGLVVEEGTLAPLLAGGIELTINGTEAIPFRFEPLGISGEAESEASRLPPIVEGGAEVAVDVMFPGRR